MASSPVSIHSSDIDPIHPSTEKLLSLPLPVHTRFLADAAAAGLDTLSGFELFFHQGADGLEIFFGGTVDRVRLRQAVGESGRASAA